MNANISPRQQKLLHYLVQGYSQARAARESGYHPVTACNILKRPEVRAELERLRAEAEQELLSRLPKLVAQALDVLERALSYKNRPAEQVMAARTILHLAERLSFRPVVEKPNSDTAIVIDFQPPEPPTDSH